MKNTQETQNMDRRLFVAGLAGLVPFASGAAQTEDTSNLWGGPVVDCHHHLRRPMELNTAHLQGSGVSNALLLVRAEWAPHVQELRDKYPGKYLAWFASTDLTKPEAADVLTKSVKSGAIGLGELKNHVEAAGPELRRMYSLAADLDVPILVHFQEVPHTPTEGTFATGFKEFEKILKAYPKTRFIGHADAFWANVSADYKNEAAYPAGKIVRGGITDKLLSDYGNLFGDLAANSGNNALSRDPEFTTDFLKRHQNKLIFGSDCFCADGKGTGIAQAGNPAASRMAGKCVARETLTVLKKHSSPTAFRKMTWENAHRIYHLPKS